MWGLFVLPALAAALAAAPPPPNVAAVVEQLEQSGALDAAVERAMQRRAARREAERRAEEAKAAAERDRALAGVRAPGPGDHILGPADAPVSLIVWSDPECPFCKRLDDVPERAVARSAGGLNLALRLYPLRSHGAAARVAALATICVGDQAGAPGYHRFYTAYLRATAGGGAGLDSDPSRAQRRLDALARAAGARDGAALHRCVAAPDTAARLDAEVKGAESARLEGTPTLLLRDRASGRMLLLEGEMDVDRILSAARGLAAAPLDSMRPERTLSPGSR